MSKLNPSVITPRKRRWGRRLLIAFAVLAVLLVAGWFIVTSEAFFKGVILPQAGKAMNATVTAESASIKPFSSVAIRGLKVQTADTEPLLTLGEFRVRYSLMDIVRGNLKVDEVLIDSPVIDVVIHADNTCNLDALSQGGEPSPAGQPEVSKPGSSPQLDLKQFQLKNAIIRYTKEYSGGNKDTIEINGFNVSLADVRNGAAGTLEFGLAARADLNPPEPAQRGAAALKHDGKYTFTLGSDLFPTQINGSDRTDVTAASGSLADLNGFGVDLTVAMTPAEIQRMALSFRDGTNSLGELLLQGPLDALKREGQLSLALHGVDQKLFKRLESLTGQSYGAPQITFTNTITLSQGGTEVNILGRFAAAHLQIPGPATNPATLEAGMAYNLTTAMKPDGAMHLTGQFGADPVVMRDHAGEFIWPATGARLDATLRGGVTDLAEFRLQLPPTATATNELVLSGHVDATDATAITGGLKLEAETLDFTEMYERLQQLPKTAGTQPAPPAPSTPEPAPETVTFPFKDFTFETKIAHVLLRDVDVSGIHVVTTLDGGRAVVKPMQLAVNGAPVDGSVDIDLGVPGYKYDFQLKALSIPLAPLVDSFEPDRQGQIGGTVTASAAISGAGTEGGDLQKNLAGRFDLVATNLNLALENVRTPALKSLLGVLNKIPDAMSNPSGAVGSLLGGFLGNNDSGGWADEFMRSPLSDFEAHGAVSNGTLELGRTYLASKAFQSELAGTLKVSDVISNSVMHFPVKISLSKSLADKAGLTPVDTPTNAVYVALPDFVTMGGTLGAPKPDINKRVLAQLALQSSAALSRGKGGTTGDTVGGVLGAMGNLIGGTHSSQTNAPPQTEATGTNSGGGLLKSFGGLFGGGKKQSGTNEPAGQ